MLDTRHALAFRRTVGAQLIGDDGFWGEPLLFQKPDRQPHGGLCVAPGLDDFVETIAVLVRAAFYLDRALDCQFGQWCA
jgi:hypothetical protein